MTYTVNIVIGLHRDELEDWASESEEILYDVFDYFDRGGTFGFLYAGTEYCEELINGDDGRFDSLVNKFVSMTGLKPKTFIIIDSD